MGARQVPPQSAAVSFHRLQVLWDLGTVLEPCLDLDLNAAAALVDPVERDRELVGAVVLDLQLALALRDLPAFDIFDHVCVYRVADVPTVADGHILEDHSLAVTR